MISDINCLSYNPYGLSVCHIFMWTDFFSLGYLNEKIDRRRMSVDLSYLTFFSSSLYTKAVVSCIELLSITILLLTSVFKLLTYIEFSCLMAYALLFCYHHNRFICAFNCQFCFDER